MDERLLTTACIVVSVAEGATDEYGDSTEVETSTSTTCHLEAAGSRGQGFSEETGNRNVEISKWHVYLPGSVSLKGTDRLTIAGSTYALVGDPWPAIRPTTGLVDHVECVVRRLA